jgi:hypothetical protein
VPLDESNPGGIEQQELEQRKYGDTDDLEADRGIIMAAVIGTVIWAAALTCAWWAFWRS